MTFENELLREKEIQKRLAYIINYERKKKAIESLGGLEGIQETIKKLHESGLTSEEAKKMTTNEFKEYLDNINKS